jgi:DNA adenine methylase
MNNWPPGMSKEAVSVKPFLKWAGGKRWFVSRFLRWFPAGYEVYHEPFLGSGAVFFGLRPKRAQLSDANSKLIETYQAIQTEWSLVWRYLQDFSRDHSDAFYYEMREETFRSKAKEAARFIYLNRTCFNGIYRENLRGFFNVPRGTKDTVVFPDDDFQALAKSLKGAKVVVADFEVALDRVGKNDVAFVDPPYTVKHNNNGFVKYNQKIFSWADQVRLRDAVRRAEQRGAKVLVTNANHASILELYHGMGEARVLSRRSVIASSPRARGGYDELAIAVGFQFPASEKVMSGAPSSDWLAKSTF